MKKLPMIKEPTITDIYTYKDIIPCFDKVEKIITDELAGGNSIALIGDAGCMPDETYIMIDFAMMPKCDYPELKIEKWYGEEYKYFSTFDNKGAVCFNFYRLKEHKASSGNIELIIDRNSVCMGDDVESHAVK